MESYVVKMKKTFLKVFAIYPAPNDSFVLLGCYRLGQHVLVHLDREGSILYEYRFKALTATYGMVRADEVIVPETRENNITLINLTTHTTMHVPFNFMN